MLNKKIHKNLIALLVYGLAINSFIWFPTKTLGMISPLCKDRNQETIIGVSNAELSVAICKSSSNKYYYVSKEKGVSNSLVLLVNQIRYVSNPNWNPNGTSDHSVTTLYQAQNRNYTYQVFASCTPFGKYPNWATISVLKKGKKIDSQKFKDSISDEKCRCAACAE